MVGHHQAVCPLADTDQGEPHEWRPGQVETAAPVGPQQLVGCGPPLCFRQVGQVHVLPGHCDPVRDELDGPAQSLVAEGGAQVGVPGEEGFRGGAQRGDVQFALQVEGGLYRVDVLDRFVVHTVEEQSLLERGQRQDLLQTRLCHTDSLMKRARRVAPVSASAVVT